MLVVRPEKSRWKSLLRLMVAWVPGFVLVLNVAVFKSLSWQRFGLGVAFGEMVAVLSFGSVIGSRELVAHVARRRGRAAPVLGRLHSFVVAGLTLAPASYLADVVIGAWARHVGIAWDAVSGAELGRSTLLSLVLVSLYMASRTIDDLRFAEQVQQNERLRAQVAALTAQMQPHFLFNALNSLAMSVRESPQLAEELIVALSELYRAVLKASTGSVHTVAEELAICRAYLDLEKLRFGSRLRLEVVMADDAREREIPVMLIQTLVENAVRHGLAEREDGFVRVGVDVVNDELRINVDDNGVGLDATKKSASGHGIANGRARLALHYGDRARLDIASLPAGGVRASVFVPAGGGRL